MTLKFVWLKTLKASPRSCRLTRSPKLILLNSEKSTRWVGGPSIVPRPVLLTTLGATPVVGFSWKQFVLNHCKNVLGAPAFGSQSVLGRLPAISAGRSEERRVGKECRSR